MRVQFGETLRVRPGGHPICSWHVLHTKRRQEKILAGELAVMGIARCLPLVRRVRYYGGRKAIVESPCSRAISSCWGPSIKPTRPIAQKRVAAIIRVNDQRRPDWELQNL